MEDFRVNPDELLKKIKSEEQIRTRGHLKIFFGYAAGVGKTYSMLKAAHVAKRRSVDVVIGYIEPHTRPETEKLMNGLEKVPTLSIRYRGILLHEFNLDRAMKRKPQLILVDELAHTNADGCRHVKRYQDIEELLKAGIDVYTTINVQHIESLNDRIASITGIVVRERIPDFIFDRADQVELIDIEPEELIERLHAGKIYQETQAKKALGNFFDNKNLIALREIALRRCADRINQISESVRTAYKDDYYTDEHILVCLSPSPTNSKIIRTASRMANAFKGNLTALFVETSDFAVIGEDNKKRLRENIHLAEQLGATVETIYGDDIAFQIAEFARLSSVSKVVMGRSNIRRKYFFSKPSLTEKLISYTPNLDIYIIPENNTPSYRAKKIRQKKTYFVPMDIIISIFVLISATLISMIFRQFGFSEPNIIMVYILGVLFIAVMTTERIYSLISSVVSVLMFNYFFTQPYFTLKAYDDNYPVTFLIMFLSAFITSTLAVRMKQQMKKASEAAYRTKILLETNQLIQKRKEKNSIISVVANQLVKLLKRDILVYLVEKNSLAKPLTFTTDEKPIKSEYITSNEQAVAAWVFKNNKHAGATTSTLGDAKCLYLAIRAGDTVYGVVGIAMPSEPLDTFESSIMLSILGEGALALENESILEEKEHSALVAKNEQLRANLLRSISHDLRTPLTSISGNANVLLANEKDMSEENRRQLYQNIYDDSLWLINLVENLLSITRFEGGKIHLRLSTELMEEVIAEALRHIKPKNTQHKVIAKLPDEIILVKIDARLIIQVIINLVDNAIKYTPPNSEITLSAYRQDHNIIVEIADNGEGISDEEKKHVFEMFYTIKNDIADSRRSLGLGLALCKSIIMAHGGEISVFDNQPKGSIFRFTLPEEEVTLHE